VAREFDFAIHGEIAPWAAEYFPGWQGGPEGELAKIGVDGIIVATELEVVPRPETEWELVYSSEEGRVYHRRAAAFARIRSAHLVVDRLDRELFGAATVRVVENSRHRAIAEIAVPGGGPPAHIAFSRPYFRGYQARIGHQTLEVRSYRNMIPVVEVPAGTSGELVLQYRPWWLIYGGVLAGLCATVWVAAAFKAAFSARA
jgi:hypothetical protein